MIPNTIIPSEPMRGAVTKTSDLLVIRLRHLVSLDKPKNGGPFAGLAARECVKAMAEAADRLEALSVTPAPEPQPEVAAEPVVIGYTNWRGEYAEREIVPLHVWFGATDWHPEPQWLLKATDVAKGAERDFAVKDIGIKAPPVVEEAVKAETLPSVDELSQIIRIADGNHSMGAGELAEAILDAIRARSATP